jgi:hypothetical protein
MSLCSTRHGLTTYGDDFTPRIRQDETTGVTEEEEEFFEEEPQDGDDTIDFAADDLYDEDDEEEDEEEEEEAPPPTWYASIQGFIDHVNNTSQKLCKHPGWKVSIDEMLRKFKGRSAQTSRMKRKPDREGYKFFVLCCSSTGFVHSYFPGGHLEAARTKILDCVEALVIKNSSSSSSNRDVLCHALKGPALTRPNQRTVLNSANHANGHQERYLQNANSERPHHSRVVVLVCTLYFLLHHPTSRFDDDDRRKTTIALFCRHDEIGIIFPSHPQPTFPPCPTFRHRLLIQRIMMHLFRLRGARPRKICW